MSGPEISQAFGGGVAGVLAVAVVVLAGWVARMYEARLAEHRITIERLDKQLQAQTTAMTSQTVAMTRLTDAVEANLGRRVRA